MTFYLLLFKATSNLQLPHQAITTLLRHVLVATHTNISICSRRVTLTEELFLVSKSYLDSLLCVQHVFADLSTLFLPEDISTVTGTLFMIMSIIFTRCQWRDAFVSLVYRFVVKSLLQRKMRGFSSNPYLCGINSEGINSVLSWMDEFTWRKRKKEVYLLWGANSSL